MTQNQVRSKYKRNRNSGTVLFWAPECKYEVILNNVKILHQNDNKIVSDNNNIAVNISPKWDLVDDEKYESKANVYWIDVSTIHERFRSIQPWQIINHFPGMPNLARKNRMGQNFNKMLKLFPKEYAFYPKTWVLPGELNDFRQQFDNYGNSLNNKIFIIKPDAGCQGRGIFLTRSFDNVPQTDNVVAQVYIKKPLLLDGFKFDLRLYCLVTSVKPLRIYLFQDGLVRMCTEEYEKPTKQNLSMSCMHLTNYAVNKHNSNFQQPSAKTSNESQDDASKRSLKWFLNYVTDKYGQAKCNWLWKRMGTLCVRSVMSILPTLSREYDQHFKSFNGIPLMVSEYNISEAFSRDKGRSQDKDSSSGSDGEEEATQRDRNASTEPTNTNPTSADSKINNPYGYPSIRGSRCFEVLGFDVMIDSNLKPWIIEVNHLPSFGTDSPLDLDIKDRLMKEVLQCVAALPDDEQAYVNYHKAEAAKRLIESRNRQKEVNIAANAQPPPKRPIPKRIIRPKQSEEVVKEAPCRVSAPKPQIPEPFDTGFCLPERLTEIKSILYEIYEKHCPDKVSKIDRLLAKYEFREEEFLKYVYNKYNVTPPWKVPPPESMENSKNGETDAADPIATDSLVGSEKTDYNAENDLVVDAIQRNEITVPQGVHEGYHTDTEMQDKEGRENRVNSLVNASSMTSATSSKPRRITSRSLSPPSGQSNRPGPSWKMGADEESAYRQEVLEAHYPKSDDAWMRREMSILTQFTRIFPPEVSKTSDSTTTMASIGVGATATEGDDDQDYREEENDQDDDDEAGGVEKPYMSSLTKGIASPTGNAEPSTTTVKYEDIMYQVFLQDKKQALRLRCPLPARSRPHSESDTQSLPPLDRSKGHMYNSMASNAGKGTVTWRLPSSMTAAEKKDSASKVPTQSQVEAANRLSKGLSVAEQTHKYLKTRSKSTTPRAVHPSVVMDQRPYIPTINITNVAFASLMNNVQGNGSNAASNQIVQGTAQRSGNGSLSTNPSNASNVNESWAPGASTKPNYNSSILRQQLFRLDGGKKEVSIPSQYSVPGIYRSGDNVLSSDVSQVFGLSEKEGMLTSQSSFNNGIPIGQSPKNGSKGMRSMTDKEPSIKQLFPVWLNKSLT